MYCGCSRHPQSGMGHAITINSTLDCMEINVDGGQQKDIKALGLPNVLSWRLMS